MIDDFVNKLTNLFEKFGDPSLNPDKYSSNESELKIYNPLISIAYPISSNF